MREENTGEGRKENFRRLRVHHLLCIPLFRGAGYSGAFCENMTARIQELREDAFQEVQLVCEPDIICEKCPNKNPDNTCGSDGNHVARKDRALLPILELTEGRTYQVSYLFQKARERMTEEEFDSSCKNCEWYRQGYCSFKEYQKAHFLLV